MRLTQEQHDRAARIAYERMYAKNWQIDSDDDAIAMALISNFGRGPWEEQAKRLTEWANEREERFSAVRGVLDSFGIGVDRGNLEDQVKALAQDRYHVGYNHGRNAKPSEETGENPAAEIRRSTAKLILDRVTDLSCTDALIDNPASTILQLRAEFER